VNNHLKHIGIGLIYIGFVLIVMAVRLPFESLLFSIIGLVILGALNCGFYYKLKSKFWWYLPIIIGATAALVAFPFVMVSIIKTVNGG